MNTSAQPQNRRVLIIVRGRVQGVGYRYSAVRAAARLGVTGWVRNRPDGSVEVVASGRAEALAELRRALHHGPPGAAVLAVVRIDVDPTNELPTPFTVLR